MHLRMCVGIVTIVATIAACKKSAPDAGSGSVMGSGSAAVGSNGDSGSAAGSSIAGSGSATGPSVADSGSGSAGSGSGSGSGSATAVGAGSANTSYDKAAFLEDPLCLQVADKIRACVAKPEFITALDDGATAQQKKINARLRKGVKKWQQSHELCRNTWDILNYEYSGFLDKPVAFKAPNALSSCADLGAAVKAAGGLVGGDTAE